MTLVFLGRTLIADRSAPIFVESCKSVRAASRLDALGIQKEKTRMNEESGLDLKYSDGIAAARTMLALKADAVALQRRLPDGWELVDLGPSGRECRGLGVERRT